MAEDPLHSPAFIKILQYFRMDRLEEELAAEKSGDDGAENRTTPRGSNAV